MRKNVKRILLVLVLALLAFGFYYGRLYARIAASYAAKIACSSIYLSDRSPDSIRGDLYAVNMADIDVHDRDRSVTASVYGIGSATAVYKEGCGCTLLNGIEAKDLAAATYAIRDSSTGPDAMERDSAFGSYVGLQRAADSAFLEDLPGARKETRALLVIRNGKILYERYAPGFDAETRLQGWSMTKSVTNAMIGILVKQGKLSVEAPAPLDEWKRDARKEITLDHLLRMSSGLSFEENYAKPSDATKMLFLEKSAGRFALDHPLRDKPGAVFYYSSGTTNILQEIIRRQFNSLEAYQRFPYEQLFDKIGMRSAVMERDASGTYVGSSFMYATTRDWARFGLLFLNNGKWNGEQILPENWTAYSSSETKPSGGVYGAHFWMDHSDPGIPGDAFFADGYEGQFVSIIPSHNTVIVRLGLTHGTSFNNGALIKSILRAMP